MGVEGQSGVNLYISECRVHLFSRKKYARHTNRLEYQMIFQKKKKKW